MDGKKFDLNWPGPDNLFGYTGLGYGYTDGLTYARARYYQPEIGRFISEDTYKGTLGNPLSQNLYAYVANNPLIYVDPSGHFKLNPYKAQEVEYYMNQAMLQTSTKYDDYWQYRVYFGNIFKPIYNDRNNNRFKYLYGLLTQTSTVETNSRGKAYWARDQLLNAYREAIEEEVWDNLYLSLYGSIGSIGGSRGSKGAPAKGLKSTPKAAQTPKNSTSTSYSKAKYDCNCFTAGTKVQTDEGEKNIEDIQVGDKVLSKDEETGEVAYKEVTATFNHETDEIYQIHVGDQVIESTYNHPFWVDGKGWTYVKDLEVGDLLVQSDGNTLKIESIELLHKQVTVYNMTVDEFHTYFVSDLGIWVHNTGPCPFGKYEDAPYHGTTNNSVKNKAPIDGQDALNKSLSIGPNTDRRIAVSNGEFVVLDKTSDGLYHGHVRSWSELTPTMQAILRKEGLVDKKGRIK